MPAHQPATDTPKPLRRSTHKAKAKGSEHKSFRISINHNYLLCYLHPSDISTPPNHLLLPPYHPSIPKRGTRPRKKIAVAAADRKQTRSSDHFCLLLLLNPQTRKSNAAIRAGGISPPRVLATIPPITQRILARSLRFPSVSHPEHEGRPGQGDESTPRLSGFQPPSWLGRGYQNAIHRSHAIV